MSLRRELFSYLESMKDSEGMVHAGSATIAEAMKRNSVTISKNLASLAQTGNVELMKEDGKIVGLRIIEPPRSYRGVGAKRPREARKERKAVSTHRVVGEISTPMTDEYAKAKQAFERVLPTLGEFVKAEWHNQPLAEEALALKKQNENLFSQLRELRENYTVLKREADYLRLAQDKELRNGLKEAGALVEHGS